MISLENVSRDMHYSHHGSMDSQRSLDSSSTSIALVMIREGGEGWEITHIEAYTGIHLDGG